MEGGGSPAPSLAGEPGQAFLGERLSPLHAVLALLPSPPGWKFSPLQVLSPFWISWHKLGRFSVCPLLGEDLIFLGRLSYYFFICFSVSKVLLPLSPACSVFYHSGCFVLERFGGRGGF